MNKYTERAERYYQVMIEEQEVECKLTTCLQRYGGGDNKRECFSKGHVFCDCKHCIKNPTCLRCRLFMNNGDYL